MDTKSYATIFQNGINEYEGLQNRQDSCIRTNVLFGQDIWCEPNEDSINQVNKIKSQDIMDEYNTIKWELLPDPDIQRAIGQIIDEDEKNNK